MFLAGDAYSLMLTLGPKRSEGMQIKNPSKGSQVDSVLIGLRVRLRV